MSTYNSIDLYNKLNLLINTKSDKFVNMIYYLQCPRQLNLFYEEYINKYDYMIGNKADGIRTILFVKNNKVYLVSTTSIINIGETKVEMNDIIMDGEHIISQNKYVCFDILYIDKINIENDIIKKLELCNNYIKYLPYDIEIRKLYKFDEYKNRKKEKYPIDGVVFIPINNNYPIYKWKPLNKLTIDFQLKETTINNKYILCVKDKDNIIPYKYKGNVYRTSEPSFKNGMIIECKWKNDTFVPIRIRKDRISPNSLNTANHIMKSIKSYINLDDILNSM